MARAVGDLVGNCVATVVVASWEGDLDHARATAVLDGTFVAPVAHGNGVVGRSSMA